MKLIKIKKIQRIDTKEKGSFNKIVDLNFVGAMPNVGNGRNDIPKRLARHFNVLGLPEMTRDSQCTIYTSLFDKWSSGMTSSFDSQKIGQEIVEFSIDIYECVSKQFLPTPEKCHYIFNTRDLSKVFNGIFNTNSRDINTPLDIVNLWLHESKRVYFDRLVCSEDRDILSMKLNEAIASKNIFTDSDDIELVNENIVYSNLGQSTELAESYQPMSDLSTCKDVIYQYLDDFNDNSPVKMKLIIFDKLVLQICHMLRILGQPSGHGLLLGLPGSGRKSIIQLCSFM